MRLGLSSHVFLPQRLHTGLLDTLRNAGAEAIEIFAARHHFDYTDRAATREVARWFNDSGILPTLHQPLFADPEWSRYMSPGLNLLDPDKSRRILAMDEAKRALESAEHIPFRSITLHLGTPSDHWSPRTLEFSLTAIEHLKAFATPLGVQILIENIPNDVTTPEHLLEILRVGHFDTVGVTLDLGHTHLLTSREHHTAPDRRALPDPHDGSTPRGAGDRRARFDPLHTHTSARPGEPDPGMPPPGTPDHAFFLLEPRLAELHLHDNDGTRDAHLWPGTPTTGGIDWTALAPRLTALPDTVPAILEIAYDPALSPDEVLTQARAAFDLLRRAADTALEPR